MKLPAEAWRRGMIAAVWAIVVLRIASELTGRGAVFWQMDLKTLFHEQASFYAGVYPHFAITPTPAGELPVRSSYPPFSFPLFLPWLPPGFGLLATRCWFAGCQMAAMGTIVSFAWWQGRAGGRGLGWLLTGSVLAMSGLRADLLFGNVSLITTALLVGVCVTMQQQRWRSAGVAWVASMVKPQVGWLFALAFLRGKAWRPLAGGAAAIVGALALACVWTKVTPWQIARSSYVEDLSGWSAIGQLNNLVTLLTAAGLPSRAGLVVCAGIGVGVGGYLLWRPLARAGVLQQFAVLGIINRLCTYHNYCDDLLLVFALIWLGRRAWLGDAWADRVAFVVLGVSVWLPAIALSFLWVKILVLLSWMALATWIARGDEAELTARSGRK